MKNIVQCSTRIKNNPTSKHVGWYKSIIKQNRQCLREFNEDDIEALYPEDGLSDYVNEKIKKLT